MKALRTLATTTAVVGLLAGTALQASAQSTTEVTAKRLQDQRSVAVNFADLNLDSPEGQEVLYNRIARAADEVCGPRSTRRAGSLAQASRNRTCYKETISRSMSKISSSALAAVR